MLWGVRSLGESYDLSGTVVASFQLDHQRQQTITMSSVSRLPCTQLSYLSCPIVYSRSMNHTKQSMLRTTLLPLEISHIPLSLLSFQPDLPFVCASFMLLYLFQILQHLSGLGISTLLTGQLKSPCPKIRPTLARTNHAHENEKAHLSFMVHSSFH